MSSGRAAHPWPDEIELLLACARRAMRSEDVVRARAAVATGLDWDLLHAAARAHGLTPLLHRHAHASGLDVPEGVMARLREQSAAITRRNLRLSSALLAVLRDFDAAGILVVPLKGPVLAERAYGSVALRRMIDLDLLVAPGSAAAAVALLESRGYGIRTGFAPAFDEAAGGELAHHVPLRSADGATSIELHRYLVAPTGGRAVTLDTLAPRLRAGQFMGAPIRELSAEDAIVYLCRHGAAHAWERLEWLAAVGELLRSAPVDEARLAAIAAEDGETRRVRTARALVRRLLDEPDASTDAGDRWMARATAVVVGALRQNPAAASIPWRRRLLFNLCTDARSMERMRRLAIAIARPSEADMIARLPRLRWLRGALRPLRNATSFLVRR